jgi:hypothetical protein
VPNPQWLGLGVESVEAPSPGYVLGTRVPAVRMGGHPLRGSNGVTIVYVVHRMCGLWW